ncbi:hypothetical protein GCM10023204_31680 [Actinomycetospora succinea]
MPPVPRDVSLLTRANAPLHPPVPTRSRRGGVAFTGAAVAAVLVGLLLGALAARIPWTTTEARPAAGVGTAAPPEVLFEVTGGAARVLVTWGSEDQLTRQNGVVLPWSATGRSRERATYVLTAQGASDVGDRITCRVTVQGVVVAEQTSSEESTNVACVGAVDDS